MYKRSAYLCKNSVTFTEKLVSSDEIAIADVIRNYHHAIVTKDIAAILVFLLPGAKITSLRNRQSVKLSKEFFAKRFKGLVIVSFENISIRFDGSAEAIAPHDLTFCYAGGIVEHRHRVWTFKKTSGVWRIAATEIYS